MNIIRAMRSWGRKKYDSFYCKKLSGIEVFGDANSDSWHIFSSELNEKAVVYSAGVGLDISFERELVSKYKVNIELFDPSPTGMTTMNKEENKIPLIHYSPIGIAGKSGPIKFSSPENELEGSFRNYVGSKDSVEFECKDLSTIMKERGHSKIDLLKIDIEGFEYEVIDDIVNKSIDIKQICVEFHHFMNNIKRERTTNAIAKLKVVGFDIIYKTKYDYTFLRRN